MDVLLWYGEITWDYIKQMLPCAVGAAAVFFCLLNINVCEYDTEK